MTQPGLNFWNFGKPVQLVEELLLTGVSRPIPGSDTPTSWIEATLPGLSADQIRGIQVAREAGHAIDSYVRSGLSQLGLDVTLDPTTLKFKRKVTIEGRLTSYLPGEKGKVLLGAVQRLHRDRLSLQLGRLGIRESNGHVSKTGIEAAIAAEKLWIPPGSQILADGTVKVPITQAEYLLNPDLFINVKRQRAALGGGRQALRQGLLMLSPEHRASVLGPKDFLTTGIQLSTGAFSAVIDRVLPGTEGDVLALNARFLDGLKTSGYSLADGKPLLRQLKIVNTGEQDHAPQFVHMKFYPLPVEKREFSKTYFDRRALRLGLDLPHLMAENTDVLLALLEKLKNPNDAVFMAENRMIRYESLGDLFWEANRQSAAASLIRDDRDNPLIERGSKIPETYQKLVNRLASVGGPQDMGRVMMSRVLPDFADLDKMVEAGVRAFVFAEFPGTGNYMTAEMHSHIWRLQKQGVSFLMRFKKAEGGFEIRHLDKRGFLTKSDQIDRVDKVTTTIAFYGSNVSQAVEAATPVIRKLMHALYRIFGETVGVTHGNGPGMMELSDTMAGEAQVPRYGVAIAVEERGQSMGYSAQSLIGFRNLDRLHRQNIMDSILTFAVFMIGGYGTNEEIAVRVCSQKLGRGLVTPLIFLDPFGFGNEGENMWTDTQKQMRVIGQTKKLRELHGKISAAVRENNLDDTRFGDPFVANYMHMVSTAEEAAQIIENFKLNPQGYYEELLAKTVKSYGPLLTPVIRDQLAKQLFVLVARGYISAVQKARDTGFEMPAWYSQSVVENMKRDWGIKLDPATEYDVIQFFRFDAR